jgi:hypothetical protein
MTSHVCATSRRRYLTLAEVCPGFAALVERFIAEDQAGDTARAEATWGEAVRLAGAFSLGRDLFRSDVKTALVGLCHQGAIGDFTLQRTLSELGLVDA